MCSKGAGRAPGDRAPMKGETQPCSVDGPVSVQRTESRSEGGEVRSSPRCAYLTAGCRLRGSGERGRQRGTTATPRTL